MRTKDLDGGASDFGVFGEKTVFEILEGGADLLGVGEDDALRGIRVQVHATSHLFDQLVGFNGLCLVGRENGDVVHVGDGADTVDFVECFEHVLDREAEEGRACSGSLTTTGFGVDDLSVEGADAQLGLDAILNSEEAAKVREVFRGVPHRSSAGSVERVFEVDGEDNVSGAFVVSDFGEVAADVFADFVDDELSTTAVGDASLDCAEGFLEVVRFSGEDKAGSDLEKDFAEGDRADTAVGLVERDETASVDASLDRFRNETVADILCELRKDGGVVFVGESSGEEFFCPGGVSRGGSRACGLDSVDQS